MFSSVLRRLCNHDWVFSLQMLLSTVSLRMQSNRLWRGEVSAAAAARIFRLRNLLLTTATSLTPTIDFPFAYALHIRTRKQAKENLDKHQALKRTD